MANYTDYTARPGDTVLGIINNTYGKLPQVEKDRMLEEFEYLNKRKAGDIKAYETYLIPTSTYYRDQVGERFGPDELLEAISTGAAYRNKALGRVNSWRELAGLGPATFTPSTLASSLRSYSTATDKDIEDRIVAEALAAGIGRMKDLDAWFTQRGYDKVFLKGTADALRARLSEERSAELHPGKVTKQFQEIETGNTRIIIRDGNHVPQVRTEESGWEWIDDPGRQAYPRYQPTALTTYKDLNGRLRWKEGPDIGRLVSETEGLPMVAKEYAPKDPALTTDANGRKRFVVSGKLVFPTLEVDPTTKKDTNGRLRFVGGPKDGDLVFTQDGKPIPKEYAPKDPKIMKDNNGRLVFVTGDRAGELLFPNLEVDPTTKQDVNGRLRYLGGPKDGEFVFGGPGGVPKEYAPKDPPTKKAADGYLYYETGPDKGKRVFPDVSIDPKTHTDVNGRLRYTEGDNEGELVFGEIAKEYAPKDPSTKKAKDGFLYYTSGPKEGERVFPNIKVEPKTHTDVNGRLRYSEGPDKGKFVFDEVPKEYKPTEDTGKRRDWDYWVVLENKRRKEAGETPMTTEELAQSFEDKVLKQQIVEEISEPGESKALAEKQVNFLDASYLIKRMLKQLEDPEVLIGGVSSIMTGFDSITGQYRQIANIKGEGHLLNESLYDFGIAAKSGQLTSNIIGMAYSLARSNEETGGRLSESDVQYAIKQITGNLQSKSSMAGALIEVFNRTLVNMKHKYQLARERGVKGTSRTWAEFIGPVGIGHLEHFTANNGRSAGMGYRIPVTENGVVIMKIQPIAMWEVK
jgi:hypothetical protein